MDYSVSRYTYDSGTYFSPHAHGVDKIDDVLAGRFRMGMQEGTVILDAGDLLEVPRGILQ